MAANSGKQNFVFNSAGDTTTISILGTIGESWFGDGYTMQDAKRDLNNVRTPKLNLVVSSLGGDTGEALTIHDLIKEMNVEVTSQILGATASSGTIVAQAADKGKITMSVNAQHLVHNVWSGIVGNAADMRKQADEQDKFDNTIAELYARDNEKKTKDEILGLMSQDTWINADKAIEWGFVDSSFTPGKESQVMDKYNSALINSHEGFPNIDETKEPDKPATEPNKNILNMFNDKFKALTALINGVTNSQPEPPAPVATDKDIEVQNMVADLQVEMGTLATANQALTNQLADKTTEYDKIFADYKALAVTHAHKTEIEEIDAEIDANADAANTNEKSHNANAAVLREG